MRVSPILVVVSLLSGLAFAPCAHAQSATARERVKASYLIAFGRAATDAEVDYWAKQNPHSVGDLVSNHRNYLSRDAGTHHSTITRAYQDALGRNPTPAEIKYWSGGTDTYAQLVKNHIAWLGGNPAEYDAVIKRSYHFALHREPSAAEITYWKRQGTLSYIVLVGCHEDWKRRNGNAAHTSGSPTLAANSGSLSTIALSPAIANEARSAAGVVAPGGGNVIAPGGGNVIAPGGGNVVAPGGGNVIAVGGGNVVAAGGLN